MFFAPFTCSSIGVETELSTVRASAPGYVARVRMIGGTISGNWAIGRRETITAPAITKKMAMTIATIGRLMKNFDIASAFVTRRVGDRNRSGLWIHGHSVLDLL